MKIIGEILLGIIGFILFLVAVFLVAFLPLIMYTRAEAGIWPYWVLYAAMYPLIPPTLVCLWAIGRGIRIDVESK